MSDDTMTLYAKNPRLITPSLSGAIYDEELQRRQERKTGVPRKELQSTHPIDEEFETLGKAEMERKELELEKTEMSMEHAEAGEERAERNEELRNEREERMTRSQEANQSLAREKFDYEKQQDAAKAAAAQQEKIGAAFRAFGNAIARGFSGASAGGGGGRLGSPQNVEAFRITPAPQRTPPRPGGS
jgi:hypothetical protein